MLVLILVDRLISLIVDLSSSFSRSCFVVSVCLVLTSPLPARVQWFVVICSNSMLTSFTLRVVVHIYLCTIFSYCNAAYKWATAISQFMYLPVSEQIMAYK